MKYVLASNNKDKMVEMKRILEGIDIISQSEAGLHLEVEETGTTFAENALLKAKTACDALNMPAIADDSGICVDALGGAPGVYSARYGGEGLDDVGRLNLLLKNMENEENRAAKFVCSIACVMPNGDVITADGEVHGVLLREPRGSGGFGYDPIFYVPELGVTTAEMTMEDKNKISHRGRALRAFKEKLNLYLEKSL